MIIHFDIDKEIKNIPRDIPGGPVVKTPYASNAVGWAWGGTGSISGWEPKILHALWCGQKIKKTKTNYPKLIVIM